MRIPVLLCVALAAGCSAPSEVDSYSAPIGLITERDAANSMPPSIAIKQGPADNCGFVFRLTDATRIYRRGLRARVEPVTQSELRVGHAVRVTWSGGMRSVCPGRADATTVELFN